MNTFRKLKELHQILTSGDSNVRLRKYLEPKGAKIRVRSSPQSPHQIERHLGRHSSFCAPKYPGNLWNSRGCVLVGIRIASISLAAMNLELLSTKSANLYPSV